MKRTFKFLFNFLLALMAVAITFAVLLWLNPAWQKRAIEAALSADSARQWQIGELACGLERIQASDVFVLDGKAGIEVSAFSIHGPMWKMLLTRRIEVESGELAGLFIDVSQVRVGDVTSSDYQAFLQRVGSDADFWRERTGLVLSKLAAAGWHSHLRNVDVEGQVLMPGGNLVPLNLKIIEADSRELSGIQLRVASLPAVRD